ncbi:hypothetical protein [Nocardioides antri]|uniref:hypothetical protein n=1 Tax=Nocardioides antri TaxID=2607659 RepID=UPI00165EE826|nr:hypothetical protein [Nocardioides antri]
MTVASATTRCAAISEFDSALATKPATVLIVGALIAFTPLAGSYVLLFGAAALLAVRASRTPAGVPQPVRSELRG